MNCAELERVKNSKSTEEINYGNPAHVNNDITLGFGSLGCIIYKYHYHKYHRRLGFSGERRNALTACANRASLIYHRSIGHILFIGATTTCSSQQRNLKDPSSLIRRFTRINIWPSPIPDLHKRPRLICNLTRLTHKYLSTV